MPNTYSVGAQSYLALYDEPTWGTTPSPVTYYHIPVMDYGVRFRTTRRRAEMYDGLFQKKHGKNMRGQPAGRLVTSLFGWRDTSISGSTSLAEYCLNWALLNHEDQILPSKGAFWAQGPNTSNKIHTGLQVNRAVLTGSEQSMVIGLALDLMGQQEKKQSVAGTAPALPDDRNAEVEFQFSDVLFYLYGDDLPSGGGLMNIGSFALDINHGLTSRWQNSYTPTIQVKTNRRVNFSITPAKKDPTGDYFDYLRTLPAMTEFVGQLVLKGYHMGTGATGSYAVITLDFPRLQFADSEDIGGKTDIIDQGLQFDVLKPDTSSLDVALTASEA